MRHVHFNHNRLTRKQVKNAARKLRKVIIGSQLDGLTTGAAIFDHVAKIVDEELLVVGPITLAVESMDEFKHKFGLNVPSLT